MDSDTAEYANWIDPRTGLAVRYALAVFHEIDFVANEGYRRIPYGGIETGGLLFGKQDSEGITIDAFRAIECEHASGPSFVLSERDLKKLRDQITNSANDPELAGLAPVGWFIAHTRSALVLLEREVRLFDDLFPTPGQLTLLVKPEKFKPTLFSFFVRAKQGALELDGTSSAIILPLPGHGAFSESLPAAAVDAEPLEMLDSLIEPDPLIEPEPEPLPDPEPLPAPAAVPISPLPIPPPPPPVRAPQPYAPPTAERRPSRAGFGLVLLLAAALGCAVGYWAYLQLPAPIIPLSTRLQGDTLTVAWPANQTAGAIYAAIRVNDGPPVLLQGKDKSDGLTQVLATGDDTKVELIVRHWMRDSRGIVRYVKAQ